MSESIDLISKRAAMKGIESAINLYMTRVEGLTHEYAALAAEIEILQNTPPGAQP